MLFNGYRVTLSMMVVGMHINSLAHGACTGSKNEEQHGAPGQCEHEFLETQTAKTEFGRIAEKCAMPQQFCTGGQARLDKTFSKLVYWKKGEKQSSPSIIDILDCTDEELERMIGCASPSPFGKGSQTIYDESVRKACEFEAKEIFTQFVPVYNTDLYRKVRKLLGDRDFIVKPHKLAIYREGGHFAKHKDTVRGEGMVASLVVCLPFTFEGGVLSVTDKRGIRIDFEWGTSSMEHRMDWACFFCDVDHGVSAVTKGTRLTLTYDVYLVKSTAENMEERVMQENEKKVGILASRELGLFLQRLDGEKRYAYYPAHDYSFGSTGSWEEEDGEDNLESVLKGMDLMLFRALKENGWCARLLVLYPDVELYGPVVDFDVGKSPEDPVDMEYAIDSDDKERLCGTDELIEINSSQQKSSVIYEYNYYHGYTGNEAFEDRDLYYASTVLVFSRHSISLDR